MEARNALLSKWFVVVLSFVFAASFFYSAASSAPMTFAGKGTKTLGPFDVTEGTLTFRIKTATECQSCGFSIGFDSDNNLDGVFGGDGDHFWTSVLAKGYEEIQNMDVTVNSTTAGGRIKITAGGISSEPVSWEVTIEQHPRPMHEIEIGVFDESARGGPSWAGIIDNADIVLRDSEGNVYKPAGFSTYGKAHYYFDEKFYGYKDYTVSVSAPGYSPATVAITMDDWKALGFPSWPLYKKVYLASKTMEEKRAAISCEVTDAETGNPIKGATVTASDSSGYKKTATTDEKGLCNFDDLNEGLHTLEASAKGYKSETKEANALKSSTVEFVRFKLKKDINISIDLKAP